MLLRRPRLTTLLTLSIASFCASSFALAPRAFAQTTQVNDADRAAARELFVEGVKLQDQGKFAEALDKFQRAQSVFSAPTHLLHIAECQAALGRLVESAETYRTLVRTPLPAGSPNAFVQAQQQGGAELTQVEPRIPAIKVQVKPENVQNLNVQIDGQPMSAALVGVPRPANPGDHSVVVYAPGYGKAEQRITLKEKETKEVPIVLQPTSGVVYGPVTPLPSQPPPPPPSYQMTVQPMANQPPEYQPPVEKKKGSSLGFMFGPHVGVGVPGGNFSGNDGDALTGDRSVANTHGVGGTFGIDAGLRFARVLYLGAVYDHGIYSRGSKIDEASNRLNSDVTLTSTNSSNYFGLNFAWISNPEGVGFWGEIGVGYRWLTTTITTSSSIDSTFGGEASETWKGAEGSIGAGVAIRVSPVFRLIPKAVIGGGSFNKVDLTCSSNATGSCQTLSGTTFTGASNDITSTETHTFVFLGIAGMFDFGKKPE